MDRGDVMSGIDLLNMAPSHHNDDVIHRERERQIKQLLCKFFETFNDLGN